MHLIGNMLFLWVFADNIEAKIGSLHFMIFYLAGAIFASFAHIYFSTTSTELVRYLYALFRIQSMCRWNEYFSCSHPFIGEQVEQYQQC